MNDVELAQAMKGYVEDVDRVPPDWQTVEAAAGEAVIARRRSRRWIGGGAIAAVFLVVVLIAAGLSRDDGRRLRAADGPGNVVTSQPTPTSGSPVAPNSYDPDTEGIWPIASDTDLSLYRQSGSTEYDAPSTTATSFLRTYGGVTDPVVGVFQKGEEQNGRQTGELAAGTKDVVSLSMTVLVAETYPGGPWTVTGVRCSSIILDEPQPHSEIVSPTPLAGQAWAFEGTVNVEVRQDGQVAGQNLGTTFVTGGGDQLSPFTGEVGFGEPSQPGGAIVLIEHSARDGSPIRLSVSRIHFGS